MQLKLFELHFSQLKQEWENAKYNSYSDLRKKDYHDKLSKIITSIEKEDFAKFGDPEIVQRFSVINFLFKSLEFLNNSTTSTIPFEIVSVLETALNEWSPKEEYIIVTSLINGINGFSFDNYLMFNDFVYKDIELLYGVKFERKLVQINLPESTCKDYLANVVLYHELAHFVDKKYEITRVIYLEIIDQLSTGVLAKAERDDLLKYYPYLTIPGYIDYFKNNYQPFNLFYNHIAEYFCDLFASQYILGCLNYYLEYITLNQGTHSLTHPSTINRVDFTNTYLNSRPSYMLELFKKVTYKITGINIEDKTMSITSKNFEKLIPVEINNSKELHSLFVYGWNVWLNDWKEIEKQSNIGFTLTQVKVYEIINNLIEKSIGNYIIKKHWERAKS